MSRWMRRGEEETVCRKELVLFKGPFDNNVNKTWMTNAITFRGKGRATHPPQLSLAQP